MRIIIDFEDSMQEDIEIEGVDSFLLGGWATNPLDAEKKRQEFHRFHIHGSNFNELRGLTHTLDCELQDVRAQLLHRQILEAQKAQQIAKMVAGRNGGVGRA